MTIQVDTLYRRILHVQEQIEGLKELKDSICRFFKIIKKLEIEIEVQQKKIDAYLSNQEPELQDLEFFINVIQNQSLEYIVTEGCLMCLKLLLIQNELILRQQNQGQEQEQEQNNWLVLKKQKNEDVVQQWDDFIHSLLIKLTQIPISHKLNTQIIHFLIILIRSSKKLQNSALQAGCIRIMLQKLNTEDITYEIAIDSLTCLRDVCKNNQKSCDLLNNHNAEKSLLKTIINFRESFQISSLVSQILEKITEGSNVDMNNFYQNIKKSGKSIIFYNKLNLTNKADETVQSSIKDTHQLFEQMRLYSLLTVFCRKMVENNFHQSLISTLNKLVALEFDVKKQESDNNNSDILNSHIMADTLIILNRILKLPETQTKKDENIPLLLQKNFSLLLLDVLRKQQNLREVVYIALESYLILVNNEHTKQNFIDFSLQVNLVDDLVIISDIYPSDRQIYDRICALIFFFAKSYSKNAQYKLKNNQNIQNMLKKFKQNLRGKEDKMNHLKYLDNLADIESSQDKKSQEKNLDYLKQEINKENQHKQKDSDKSGLVKEDDIDDLIYDLQIFKLDDKDIQDNNIMDMNNQRDSKDLEQEDTQDYNVIEILRKLLNQEDQVEKYVTEDLIKAVLRNLRLHADNRDQVIPGLRFINNCAQNEKFIDIIAKNKGVESVFIVLNQHPTDKDIIEIAGEILAQLDAENLAKEVKSQYDELAKEFNPKDKESVEGVRQANIYLANLCTAVPDEEDQELIDQNQNLIKNLDILFQKGLPLEYYASLLLLISRLANQGEETKNLIRNSQLPQKIIDIIILDENLMNIEKSGRIPEFTIDALVGMISGGDDLLPMLDIQTGKKVNYQTQEILVKQIEPLQKLISQDEYKSLRIIVSLLDLNYQQEIQTIEKVASFLARLIECCPQFLKQIQQFMADQKIITIFQKLNIQQKNEPIKSHSFTKLGKIIGVFALKDEKLYQNILKNTQILSYAQETMLNIKIQSQLVHNLYQLDTLSSVISVLKNMLNNQFDKSDIIKSQTHITILKVLNRMIQIDSEKYQDSGYLCLLLRQGLQLLETMLEDKSISIEIFKQYDLIKNLIKFSEKIYEKKYTEKEEDNKPNPINEIIGLSDNYIRTVEQIYTVIELYFNNVNIASEISKQYRPDYKFVDLVVIQNNEPYMVTKMLQSLIRLVITYSENTQSRNQDKYYVDNEKFSNDIKLLQKYIENKYPNIPIINDLYQKLVKYEKYLQEEPEKLAKIKEQLYNIHTAKDLFRQSMINLARMSVIFNSTNEEENNDHIDDIIKDMQDEKEEKEQQQVVQQQAQDSDSEDEESDIIQSQVQKQMQEDQIQEQKEQQKKDEFKKELLNSNIADTVNQVQQELQQFIEDLGNQQEFSQDYIEFIMQLLQAIMHYVIDESTALDVHNKGITEDLLIILSQYENMDKKITQITCKCLKHVTTYKSALNHLDEPINFAQIIIPFIENIYQNQEYDKSLLFILEALKNTCRHSIKTIISMNGIPLLSNLLNQDTQNIRRLCLLSVIIDKIAINDAICQQIVPENLLEQIESYFKQYSDRKEFLTTFSLLLGTICRSHSLQEKVGKMEFITHIVQGIKNFQDDIRLATNSIYALSGISYNNVENSTQIASQGIFQICKQYLENFKDHQLLVETICSLFSNLTFKNQQNKQQMGESGNILTLINIAKYYCEKDELNSRTIKQIFRALGNSSLLIQNTKIIVKNNYIKIFNNLVERLKYKDQGDIIRYGLDLISNLSSHKDEYNNKNTILILQQGGVDTIMNTFQKNVLNTELLNSCIDALDGMIQNKLVSMQVVELKSIQLLIKVMRSQDYGSDLILKGARLLSNLALVKQNLSDLISNKLPITIGDILKHQHKPKQKLITYCFRILNRICTDVGRVNLPTSGIIEALGFAICHQGISKDNIRNILLLLKNISQIRQAIPIIAQHPLQYVLQRGLEYKLEVDLLELSIQLAYVITYKYQQNACQIIADNGGIELILYVLKYQATKQDIQDQSLQILNKICVYSDVLMKKAKNQNTKAVVTALYETKEGRTKDLSYKLLNNLLNDTEDKLDFFNKFNKSKLGNKIQNPEETLSLDSYTKNILSKGFVGKLFRHDNKTKTCKIFLSEDDKQIVAVRIKHNELQYELPVNEITGFNFSYTKGSNSWEQSRFRQSGKLIKKHPHPERCISIFGDNDKSLDVEIDEDESKQEIEIYLNKLYEFQRKLKNKLI